jgi:ribosomal protein L24
VLKPGDKIIVRQYDGKTVHGEVILVDKNTQKVRVQTGEFVLNVSEEQITKE